jgi:hypothetical protein
MDMAARFQDQTVFHMTGKRSDELSAIDVGGLRPAPFAAYRDLTRLRYDFPVVLPQPGNDAGFALSLSSVVNGLLQTIAPRGLEGERMRKQVLRLERELRVMLAQGTGGTLTDLWAAAVERLAAEFDDTARKVLAQAGESLPADGALIDCDPHLPALFISHAWRHTHAAKARRFRTLVDNLVRKLSDIQRAAFVRSAAGQQPEALRTAIGVGHADVFDFAVMSKLVARHSRQEELPAARAKRIDWALRVLRAQPFYPAPDTGPNAAAWAFVFEDCAAAVEAYRVRLPRLVGVVKAIAVAELESAGAYVDADHDPFFERYDEHALSADDLALFPDYLVLMPPGRNDAPENAGLLDMLSSGLPVKVLVQHTDLLEEASIGTGHFAFGVRAARLATTAMGLGGMFVLQSTSADLYALRERVLRGLACRGPALFSVFAGSPAAAGDLPPYLTAAAAAESRAFPPFTYDAAAGTNWAARFSLEHNRNADADWAGQAFDYADDALQRVSIDIAFTYADFVLCDRRYHAHFAVVARERWGAAMLPAADWLQLSERVAAERVPYVWAVDAEDRLHRVIVDTRLMQAVRRNLLLWHRLQEHAGIHDSHAERLLAREKENWEAQKRAEIEAMRKAAGSSAPVSAAPAAPAAPAAAAGPAPAAAEAAAEKPPSDEAWIETARCPSCNECQIINDRMFVYNENKQAYIKDINAGTYRQLVEAAEACQVAIIHPGKPRNPNEPGLEELLERAKPFL